MRVCFNTFCFAPDEEPPGDLDPAPDPPTTLVTDTPHPINMGSVTQPQEMQNLRDKVRDLEEKLRQRDEEISQLRSHLDKYQSVMPALCYGNVASPKHKGLNNNVGPRPRKQRAQGISAEPHSEASLLELARQTFQVYPKNER